MNENVHDVWMTRAIELSRSGFPAPNPRVGCVVVRDGRIIGEGFHEYAGGPHAEIRALECVPDAAHATVYVTMEPCNHHGRTGPCSQALVRAGVSSVVYAVKDPNPVAAGGAEVLVAAGIEVVGGVLEAEASEVNRVWLQAMGMKRPYVVLKAAISNDGFAAPLDRSQQWLTGVDARAEGHRLRAELGCVLVGPTTVEADDPMLTARLDGVVNPPLRVVLDPLARCLLRAKVFDEAAPTLRFVGKGMSSRAGDIELGLDERGHFSIPDVLEVLFLRGVRGVLVEGGPGTWASFLKSGLVDELRLFVSPEPLGSGIVWAVGNVLKSGWIIEDLGFLGRDRYFRGLPRQ